MSLLQRLPTREIGFGLALVLAAGALGWASGRTAVLTEALKPGWTLMQSAVTTVRGGAAYFQDLEALRQENTRLQQSLTLAESELARRIEVDTQNKRLSQLVELQHQYGGKGVAAQVVARTPDNWRKRLVVNRGMQDGIGTDSVVMSPRGLIGRVLVAGPSTSIISLLTDPGQTVATLGQRSRSPGIVTGEGDATLAMRYMPQQVDFRIGDLVLTSGFGGVFPKGIPVGKVVRVDQRPGAITPEVTIVPTADLDRIEEVMIFPPLSPIVLPKLSS
ncbi:Cell shape-determining protein MreC precursor [compost metagenome]